MLEGKTGCQYNTAKMCIFCFGSRGSGVLPIHLDTSTPIETLVLDEKPGFFVTAILIVQVVKCGHKRTQIPLLCTQIMYNRDSTNL